MTAPRKLLLALLLFLACMVPAFAEEGLQLTALAGEAAPAEVASGRLDQRFRPFDFAALRSTRAAFWVRIEIGDRHLNHDALIIRKGRHLQLRLFAAAASADSAIAPAFSAGGFRAMHESVFALDRTLVGGQTFYAEITPEGSGSESLGFELAPLAHKLAEANNNSRVIALSFGALMAMATASLLIWAILKSSIFLLYAVLFSLQALYIAYLSGQGFDWPLLRIATPLNANAWNIPAALSGAAAALFVREIADLKRYWPRVHRIFGVLALVFLVLAVANVGQLIGLGTKVAAVGNIIFLGTAIFTLIVCFLAWRRGSRGAGWFLLAWGLLEVFTIATAARLLVDRQFDGSNLPYLGLPLAMVAAAILVALGVADRLREQRLALTDAERRAQTDPLTGMLNRRSLMERLDAACLRAQARGLPIALLFIDLDHFKQINDRYGHAAGDACLRAITAPIQSELRQSDVIGRYGGEEFIVVLSSADVAAAQLIAERIRARVAQMRVGGFGEPIELTCSIGIASSDMLGIWGEQLVARADAAVYAAKHGGRNQVQLATAAA
ncbi:MAG: diguanylate cyclase [Steroidobacteraceae bacterium]